MSETCKKLHEAFSALPRFGTGYVISQVPANGIYIVFEKGEKAHGTDRIVGVGTHSYKYRFFTPERGRVPARGVFVVFDVPFPFVFSSCSQLKV